ncbi:MAG TPA: hypothetical protein VMS54_13305 [Vicinamibacterales bacterium]|nr:hypothetical protein [Vicinamibacterales bacterium]
MSPVVGNSLRRLELQRAIAKGSQTRERWRQALDAAYEDHVAVDAVWREVDAQHRTATDALVRAREAHPDLGTDYGRLGGALNRSGEQPWQWRTEYDAWVRTRDQLAELNVPQRAAESKLRTAKDALAAADKQLADWQAELDQLERTAIHGAPTHA